MPRIVQLNDKVSNMIAAGEVVENPSSVIKELVENSIDAKSTQITIKLVDSGLKQISVIDNGIGMDKEDCRLCFKRHATSKIVSQHDLYRINTLGFRGEAIPSIASVSDMIIISSTGEEGYKINVKGNKLISEQSHQSRQGTEVTVSNLFYNTPARLKYITNKKSEIGKVTKLIESFSISNPSVSFKYFVDDRLTISTSGNNDYNELISKIYSKDIAKNSITFSYQEEAFSFTGYTTNINYTRSNRNYITLIVNNRIIKNKLILDSIVNGYGNLIPSGRYPISIISINIDPVLIDVNIHPKKTELKISNISDVINKITSTIKSTLFKEDLMYKEEVSIPFIEEFTPITEEPIKTSIPNEYFTPSLATTYEDISNSVSLDNVINSTTVEYTPISNEEILYNNVIPPKNKIRNLIYLGTLSHTYLLCQSIEGLVIVDQHAAAERINYEKVLQNFESETLTVTDYVIPQVLDFSISEKQLILENESSFKSIGIHIEDNIDNSITVRTIPTFLHNDKYNIQTIISDIVKTKDFDINKVRHAAAEMIACKSSIKANDFIDLSEVSVLIDKLSICDNPYTCPHGRPTLIEFSYKKIEKMFKRV